MKVIGLFVTILSLYSCSDSCLHWRYKKGDVVEQKLIEEYKLEYVK